VIVTGDVDDAGVKVTAQEPDEREQVVELNWDASPTEVENVTVPVGLNPVTVAVQVLGEPALVMGEQETDVAVFALVTVMEAVFELGKLPKSPP
jgi:hypothetical protein